MKRLYDLWLYWLTVGELYMIMPICWRIEGTLHPDALHFFALRLELENRLNLLRDEK